MQILVGPIFTSKKSSFAYFHQSGAMLWKICGYV